MNLYRINLNLLVAFDALMTEKHVSRAAQKLFISQSALSTALNNLRELFQDPLLIRGPKGMMPTPLAVALLPRVRQVLQQIDQIITTTEPFEPAKSEKYFRIGMSDYSEVVLLPTLYKNINNIAPNITLRIINLDKISEAKIFEERNIDLGIGMLPKTESGLATEKLFYEAPVCVAHQDNPLIQKKLTMKQYLNAKHLSFYYYDEPQLSTLDTELKKQGLSRTVAMTISHLAAIPAILENSNLLATLGKHLVSHFINNTNLKTQELPFKFPEITVIQAWHKRYNNDPAHIWLRNIVKQTVNELKLSSE